MLSFLSSFCSLFFFGVPLDIVDIWVEYLLTRARKDFRTSWKFVFFWNAMRPTPVLAEGHILKWCRKCPCYIWVVCHISACASTETSVI